LKVAIAAAQSAEVIPVIEAVYVPVDETMRQPDAIVTLEVVEFVVPRRSAVLKALSQIPVASWFGPSVPIAPMSNSSACVVVAVVFEVGAVPFPVFVDVLSSTELSASPRNTLTTAARAATDGCVMVIMLPFATALTL
jgi:hypothetical protein